MRVYSQMIIISYLPSVKLNRSLCYGSTNDRLSNTSRHAQRPVSGNRDLSAQGYSVAKSFIATSSVKPSGQYFGVFVRI